MDSKAPVILQADLRLADTRPLRTELRRRGAQVNMADSVEQAVKKALTDPPDVILLDLHMPVMNGREFFTEFRRRGFDTPVIILSAYNAEGAYNELRAQGFLDKSALPDSLGELVATVAGRSAP